MQYVVIRQSGMHAIRRTSMTDRERRFRIKLVGVL